MSLGHYLLLLAFIASAYSIWAGVSGIKLQRKSWLQNANLAVYGQFILITLSIFVLAHAFVSRDFSFRYVADYSDRHLPLLYTLSAVYAGQSGSLLFWTWLLTIFNALYIFLNRTKDDPFKHHVVATVNLVTFFFLVLVNYATNPFERLSPVPPDGMGLNPLLQNPEMIFHPPSLFLGFVGFTIPFAYAIAALAKGDVSDLWLDRSRNWTLFAWIALTVGNLLGAQWAYVELGWGGYWAWDPVENASLLPWLTGTALVHSIMAQKTRDLMRGWNVSLAILTFLLTILGTFITRSGIISSVHAFGQSNLGTLFLVFMLIILVVAIGLMVFRINKMRSKSFYESLLSRETSFLLLNIIFIVLLVMVLIGTLAPAITELFIGKQVALGESYFNRIAKPIGLVLLFLLAICPILSWRETSNQVLLNRGLYPFTTSVLFGIILYVSGINHVWALVTLVIAFLALAIIAAEIIGAASHRVKSEKMRYIPALFRTLKHNTRRYAGYLIHVGVILIYLAIVGTTAFKQEKQITLQQGQATGIGSYRLVYTGMGERHRTNQDILIAELEVFKDSKKIGILKPQRNFYHSAMGKTQYTTEVAVRSTFKEDLYAILSSYQDDGSATFTFLVNPLQIWMWIGGFVMVIGVSIILIQAARKKDSAAPSSERPKNARSSKSKKGR
ncbi:MAG: heme lyase CcmF/NrfE family subunit [candidate division KSB1 bacterium]|nr:heme lyase CcmF/NrfE family subunit [candidate division KSB1 bacterium]